jgi:hypothetical protein
MCEARLGSRLIAPLPKVGQPVIASRMLIPSINVSSSRRFDMGSCREIASEIIAVGFFTGKIDAWQLVKIPFLFKKAGEKDLATAKTRSSP